MTFNKADYWTNRKGGKRGQGEEMVINQEIVAIGAAPKKRKTVDRTYTKKGYTTIVFVDENGVSQNIRVKVGSVKHRLALHNSKKLKKQRRAKADELINQD